MILTEMGYPGRHIVDKRVAVADKQDCHWDPLKDVSPSIAYPTAKGNGGSISPETASLLEPGRLCAK